MSGGEPLSEETDAAMRTANAIIAAIDCGKISFNAFGMLPFLRAFARKIQEPLENLVAEKAAIIAASGHEKDELRAKANAAECRMAEANYRARRIVLDAELQGRATRAESALSASQESEKRLAEALEAVHPKHPQPEICIACKLLNRKV